MGTSSALTKRKAITNVEVEEKMGMGLTNTCISRSFSTRKIECFLHIVFWGLQLIVFFIALRENREMRAAQARASVEVAKEVNNDKSLKSRDKERLLKEKQANQTKVN